MSIPDIVGDPSAQMRFMTQASYWSTLLWPPALTISIAIIKRKRLLRPRLFVGLGCLICYGVIFLVGQLHVYWFIPLAARTPADELPRVIAGSLLGMLLSAVPLSFFPLYRLYRACAMPGSTSNNRWRGP
jgi:hypothetical protein